MGRKTPPFKEYPTWTTAKFWSFVRSGLRVKWTRWPPKYEALNDVRRTVTGKRHRFEYQCSACKDFFKQKEVEVDHIQPVGSLNDYKDLPGFVERLFTSKQGLRVVCKPCHKEITQRNRK